MPPLHPLLESLNEPQRRAVTTTEGPVLVLAGPGSGKTRTLTHRIAYLLAVRSVPADRIAAVTFTNKAAEEMARRVRRLCSPTSPSHNGDRLPFIGTFHRFCAQLLRRNAALAGRTPAFSIYDADDQLRLCKRVMHDQQLDPRRTSPAAVVHAISRHKCSLRTPEDLPAPQRPFERIVASVYPAYQEALAAANAFDFDDLILHAVLLLKTHPDCRERCQNAIAYLHVDEYQDTNLAQYELTRLLTERRRNLFVVGDDAQAIYSWRAADIRNIREFERDYPDASTILLEQNYRSTQPILDAASSLMTRNTQQKQKRLWTARTGGSPIIIREVADHSDEGRTIVATLDNLLTSRTATLNDAAVLYRTNAQSRALEEALINAGIPYRIVGATRFFERREIKDLLAYLTLFVNPDDPIALRRVLNVPRRGIGPKTTDDIFREGRDAAPGHRGVQEFYAVMTEGKRRVPLESSAELLSWLVAAIDYRSFLESTYPARNPITGQNDAEERWGNVEELFSVAQSFPSPGDLPRFLEETALFSPTDAATTSATPAVTLMTLHAAKGLEFPLVFITGCEDGLLPHANAETLEAVEEERRLLYVGITRAKDRVILLHASRRTLYGRTLAGIPSPFLNELPSNAVERFRIAAPPMTSTARIAADNFL